MSAVFHKALAAALALWLMVSAIGLPVVEHLCKMDGSHISLFIDTHSCEEEKAVSVKDCCHSHEEPVAAEKDDCCSSDVAMLKLQIESRNQAIDYIKTEAPAPADLLSYFSYSYLFSVLAEQATPEAMAEGPPVKFRHPSDAQPVINIFRL